MRKWGTGGQEIGDVVRIEGGLFGSRLGNTWARGRLKRGDLAVVVRHSGDHFFDYRLLDHKAIRFPDGDGEYIDGLRLEPILTSFGSYTIGRNIGHLSDADMACVMAGESFSMKMPEHWDAPTPTASDFVIWWTDLSSCAMASAVGAPFHQWPQYLNDLWARRQGVGSTRNFQLWSSPDTGWKDEFAAGLRAVDHDLTRAGIQLRDAMMGVGVGIAWGGIVIRASDANLIAGLPGFVTTTEFEIVPR